MEFEIPYGEKKIKSSLPDHWKLLSIAKPKKVQEIHEREIANRLHESLEKPIGCNSLDQLIKPSNKIVIVVDDISRPTPTHLLLTPLVDFLVETIGLTQENIKIIFALGVHRKMSEEEAKKKLGLMIAEKIAWENHDCDENLANLGKSQRETPIFINKTFVEADFAIAVGLIEPHLWAGYSGGYKAIIPGIAGADTIVQNHRLVMNKNVQVGEIESSFRKDIDEIGEKAGLNFIVNCILNSDKKITKIFSGDPSVAYREGVKYARDIFEVPIAEQADVVIAGSAPLGIDFRQSSKGALNTKAALRNGGVMIVVSPCPEGIGNIRIADKTPKRRTSMVLARILPSKMLMRILKKQGYGVEDSAGAFEMLKFVSRKKYVFVSDLLSDEEKKPLFMANHASTLEEAYELTDLLLRNKKKKPLTATIFPYGGCTYPRIQKK